jgi:hypothetical protein
MSRASGERYFRHYRGFCKRIHRTTAWRPRLASSAAIAAAISESILQLKLQEFSISYFFVERLHNYVFSPLQYRLAP